MDMEQYRAEIEAAKLATSMGARLGVPREKTLLLSIEQILDYYACNPLEEYLTGALIQIQAYLEMGMDYRKHAELFDKVVDMCGLDKDEVFPRRFYGAVKVKLNKSQVRGMLRRWTPSRVEGMKIGQVVEDIMEKVKAHQEGIYYYRNCLNDTKMGDDIYELIITKEECYFHDIKCDRYFVFVQ
ncbi:hypothetical protein ABXS75_13680 [Roseburia hominis]